MDEMKKNTGDMLLRYPPETAHASDTRHPTREIIHNNVNMLAGAGGSITAFMATGNTWRCFTAIMEETTQHLDTAEEDDEGRLWVFFSTRYFAAQYGLGDPTSRRNIAMFALFGLIEKVSSNAYMGGDYPSFMREGYDRHRNEDQFGVMWYHIPTYTPALLAEADRLAGIWQGSGYTRKSISKATLIRLYGFDLADRAYGMNAVRISCDRLQAERAIEDLVCDTIQRDGYVHPRAIEAMLDNYEKSIWPSLRPDLCDRYGWQYSRPTPDEKRRYHLTDNRWIIRPP